MKEAQSTADLIRLANRIVANLEVNEGEITGDIEAAIAAFADASGNKMQSLRAIALQADVQARNVDDEVKRLRALKSHYERIKKAAHDRAFAIAEAAEKAGADPNEKGTARLKTSIRADFPDDVDKWPEDYLRREESIRLDKAGMKKAIQAGEIEAPPGFSLQRRRYVKFDGVGAPKD